MNTLSTLSFVGKDERVRKYLCPKSIVSVRGTVENPDELLLQKSLQIGFLEPSVTTLTNGEDGENASITVDFGVEIPGGVRILNFSTNGQKYPLVRLTFGESVSETESVVGKDSSTNDHAVRQFEVPVPTYSDQEWGNTGFRFVKIELLTKSCSLQLKSLLAVFMYRDYKYLGEFECSDSTINQIYQTAAYTCHLCCQNLLWDGIKRDRLVWIGDMMPESMTLRSVFGDVSIVKESLDYAREQAPLPGWINNIPTYSMWWLMILKDWYMAFGDREFLGRQIDYVKGLVQLLCDGVAENGSIDFPGKWLMFDWPTNKNPKSINGVRAILKMALNDASFLLKEFGEEKSAQKAKQAAGFIKGELDCGDAKQIAAMLSLAGLMDPQDAAQKIMQNGAVGFSSFLSYFILKAVVLAGKDTFAVDLLKEYYGSMLEKGATSFWEDYDTAWSADSGRITDTEHNGKKDIHADYGDFCYVGLRHSLCHGWSSGAVPFLTECVLGVKPIEVGFKTVKIEPHLGSLTFAKGKIPTPYGIIKVSHRRLKDGTVKTTVHAPKEIRVV